MPQNIEAPGKFLPICNSSCSQTSENYERIASCLVEEQGAVKLLYAEQDICRVRVRHLIRAESEFDSAWRVAGLVRWIVWGKCSVDTCRINPPGGCSQLNLALVRHEP